MIRNRDRAAARHALRDLEAVGVKLPKAVSAAVTVLDRIEAAPPTAPDPNAVATAILADEPVDVITALVAEHLAHDHHRQQHRYALDTAGARVLGAILAEAGGIHQQLAAQADELIARIEAAAKINADVATLVRAGRTADAQVVATADADVAALQQLYSVRNTYLGSATNVGGVEGGVWRDPDHAERHYHQAPTVFGSWAAIIRAGGELWFPTAEEAQAVAEPIAAERQRQAREDAERHRVGTLG